MKEVKIKVPEIKDVIPEKAIEHIYNAYREILLAIREIITHNIEKSEKKIKKIEIE